MACHLGVLVMPTLDPAPRCLFSREWAPAGDLDQLQAVTTNKHQADVDQVRAHLKKYFAELGAFVDGCNNLEQL